MEISRGSVSGKDPWEKLGLSSSSAQTALQDQIKSQTAAKEGAGQINAWLRIVENIVHVMHLLHLHEL